LSLIRGRSLRHRGFLVKRCIVEQILELPDQPGCAVGNRDRCPVGVVLDRFGCQNRAAENFPRLELLVGVRG